MSTDLVSPNTSLQMAGFIEATASAYTANMVASSGFATVSTVQAVSRIFC
jgi:acetaldehyde dehydrogenase (acetylating)